MTSKNNRLLLVAGLVLLGMGFGSFMAVKEQGGIAFTWFRLERWGRATFDLEKPATPQEIRHAKLRAKAAADRALAKFPELRIEERKVRDEDNGYLRAIKLARSEEVKRMRDSKVLDIQCDENAKLDTDAVIEDFEKFEDVGHMIVEIAELRQRSSAPLAEESVFNFPGAEWKAMSDYLMLMARIAAARGDEKGALEYISYAVGLNEHLRGIEHPTLLSETVVILVDMGIRVTVFEHILPRLDRPLDLDGWQAVLTPPDRGPSRLADVMKGEWFAFSNELSSILFTPRSEFSLPDPDEFFLAYAEQCLKTVAWLRVIDEKDLATGSRVPRTAISPELSSESREDLESMGLCSGPWVKGYSRAAIIIAQYEAALDLMIREAKGTDLSALTETYVMNPLTKLPFEYDPLTREVSKNGLSGDFPIKPLVLPTP